MVIEIMNYRGDKKKVDVGELENIEEMDILILTGDEILTIYYDDGDIKKFDSSDDRLRDYYDWEYTLYDKEIEDKEQNYLFQDNWINRKSSYHYVKENED